MPGDVTRLNSRGTNLLIQSGARLVQSADDILSEMKEQLRGYLREEHVLAADGGEQGRRNPEKADGRSTVKTTKAAVTGNKLAPSLTEDERYIYNLLRHEPVVFDLLAAQIEQERMSVQKLSAVLLSLELKHAIRQLPGRFYAVFE